DNFGGRSLTLSDELGDLRRSSFNKDTVSVMVESGEWEVCTDAFFHGQCRVLTPGQYRRLEPSMSRTISSVRIAGAPVSPIARPARELFERSNFDGARFGVQRNEPDLQPYRFNDRAGSMIVH